METALQLEFEQTWDALEGIDEEDLRRMRQDQERATRLEATAMAIS